ncbi:putative ferric reductase [Acidovorax sp. 69]|uniref:ferredoxin reductase family protein n=1 Tax=Acidovorax sp. 69 TaxID=2035202 RepID=UPI000C2312A4|nr:ferric reductase-like transmembrane domain-containing protein [Acidovorax sp. 69]PJI95747.1 putative ferric reductase [Acidovorax sp. 69]
MLKKVLGGALALGLGAWLLALWVPQSAPPAWGDVWWWRNQLILLSGLAAWTLMSLVMVLAVRPQWLERPLGGLDKGYHLHKWAGIGAIVLGLVHYGLQLSRSPLAAWVGRPVRTPRVDWWLNTFRHLAEEMGEWAVWFLAAMLLITLWQRFPYHVWRYLHKLLAVVYLVLAFHSVVLTPPAWWLQPAGVLVGLCSLVGVLCAVRSLAGAIGRSRRHAARVVSVLPQEAGVLEVTCQLTTASGWHHAAGQFAFVTFAPAEGAHPFTLLNADQGDGVLRFAIKALGDYTGRLALQVQSGKEVMIEGPYGCFDFRRDRAPEQVWVAAGIGVTPFMAWLESLQAAPTRAPRVHLHYCVRHAGEAVFAERMTALCARLPSVVLEIHYSDESGPVAPAALLAGTSRAASVWFCGPQGFAEAVRQGMEQLGRSPARFHQELFQMR